MKFIDLTGQRFGRVIVLQRTQNHICSSGQQKTAWMCVCDCGTEFVATSGNLKNGHHTSCGCESKRRMVVIGKMGTHREIKTRLYRIWSGMKSRCLNPKTPKYEIYGGKGVKVCTEWLHSFENFRDWAKANGYADNLTIDRIDSNGNYEPSNCRWATYSEQNKNRTWRKGR